MREMKFRALNEINGNWEYGTGYIQIKEESVLIYNGNDSEFQPTFVIIDINTIGQYTGLKDCKGVEIYEGDRCTYKYEDFIIKNGGDTGNLELDLLPDEGIVTWVAGAFRFELPNGMWTILTNSVGIEVIGNIHDKETK